MAQVSNLLLLYIVAGTVILICPLFLFLLARTALRSQKEDLINQETKRHTSPQSLENTGYFQGVLVMTSFLSIVFILVPLTQGVLDLVRTQVVSSSMLYYLIFGFSVLGLLMVYSIRRGLLKWRS